MTYLYPYKIFTISKNKRLLDVQNPQRAIGIYDATKLNYKEACRVAEINDAMVSVLLGDIGSNIKLICLDLDDCFDENTGEMESETKDFLKEFEENEWEISSSGTGIHIYILTKLDLETFIVKELEGCKSFECYTNKRHIVTTIFDFENTNLKVGIHDNFLLDLYNRVKEIKKGSEKSNLVNDIVNTFGGTIVRSEQEINAKIYGRTPVTDMFTLRGLGYKDPEIINCIDQSPDAVDQSAWDCKLVRKLMYYCLSFDAAWEMAQKTNYFKAKDNFHKKKFNTERYKERTRQFISGGRV